MKPVRQSCGAAKIGWIRAGTGRFCASFLLALSGSAFLVPSTAAQVSRAEEYQVKAAYLYNFGKFISWPAAPSSSDSFPICVLGKDPFGASLDATIAGESIDSKRLIAKRISSADEARSCRILFVSSSESTNARDIIVSLQKEPIATVSDARGFLSKGGMIEFVLLENRVRFEVNLDAANRAGLSFSSQLLKVATQIRSRRGSGPPQ